MNEMFSFKFLYGKSWKSSCWYALYIFLLLFCEFKANGKLIPVNFFIFLVSHKMRFVDLEKLSLHWKVLTDLGLYVQRLISFTVPLYVFISFG